jgi:hypothetical protein
VSNRIKVKKWRGLGIDELIGCNFVFGIADNRYLSFVYMTDRDNIDLFEQGNNEQSKAVPIHVIFIEIMQNGKVDFLQFPIV